MPKDTAGPIPLNVAFEPCLLNLPVEAEQVGIYLVAAKGPGVWVLRKADQLCSTGSLDPG